MLQASLCLKSITSGFKTSLGLSSPPATALTSACAQSPSIGRSALRPPLPIRAASAILRHVLPASLLRESARSRACELIPRPPSLQQRTRQDRSVETHWPDTSCAYRTLHARDRCLECVPQFELAGASSVAFVANDFRRARKLTLALVDRFLGLGSEQGSSSQLSTRSGVDWWHLLLPRRHLLRCRTVLVSLVALSRSSAPGFLPP